MDLPILHGIEKYKLVRLKYLNFRSDGTFVKDVFATGINNLVCKGTLNVAGAVELDGGNVTINESRVLESGEFKPDIKIILGALQESLSFDGKSVLTKKQYENFHDSFTYLLEKLSTNSLAKDNYYKIDEKIYYFITHFTKTFTS